MIARELVEFFAGFSPDGAAGRPARRATRRFLANVNACYRRACWEEIRFDDVPYSEDQAFGRALLAAGWEKVYHPGARGAARARLRAGRRSCAATSTSTAACARRSATSSGFGVRSTVRDRARAVAARPRAGCASRAAGARAAARWTARSSVVHHGGRKAFSALGSRADRCRRPSSARCRWRARSRRLRRAVSPQSTGSAAADHPSRARSARVPSSRCSSALASRARRRCWTPVPGMSRSARRCTSRS